MPTPRPWRVHLTDDTRKPSVINYGDLRKAVALLLDGTASSIWNDTLGISYLHVMDGQLQTSRTATATEDQRWRDALAELDLPQPAPRPPAPPTVEERLEDRATQNTLATMHTVIMGGVTSTQAVMDLQTAALPASTLASLYPEWLRRQVGPLAHAWLVDDAGDVWVLIGADQTGQAVYASHDAIADSDTMEEVLGHRVVLRTLAIEDLHGIDWRGPEVALRLGAAS